MLKLLFTLTAVVALWTPLIAGPDEFGLGTIDLPSTTKDYPKRGVDSAVGTLISTDGTPDIRYDIGQGPTTFPELKPAEYIFLKTGQLNGFDYRAIIYSSDPRQLAFFLVKPRFAGFTATINSEIERDQVLKILLKYRPK